MSPILMSFDSRVDREYLPQYVDHTEIYPSYTGTFHAFDHTLLLPSGLGPIRTTKSPLCSSPYSSSSSTFSRSSWAHSEHDSEHDSDSQSESSVSASEYDKSQAGRSPSETNKETEADSSDSISSGPSVASSDLETRRDPRSNTGARDSSSSKDTSPGVPVKHRRPKNPNPAPVSVKIPKPDGEVGRPGRGGYNLEVALGWQKEKFAKVKVSVIFLPSIDSKLVHV